MGIIRLRFKQLPDDDLVDLQRDPDGTLNVHVDPDPAVPATHKKQATVQGIRQLRRGTVAGWLTALGTAVTGGIAAAPRRAHHHAGSLVTIGVGSVGVVAVGAAVGVTTLLAPPDPLDATHAHPLHTPPRTGPVGDTPALPQLLPTAGPPLPRDVITAGVLTPVPAAPHPATPVTAASSPRHAAANPPQPARVATTAPAPTVGRHAAPEVAPTAATGTATPASSGVPAGRHHTNGASAGRHAATTPTTSARTAAHGVTTTAGGTVQHVGHTVTGAVGQVGHTVTGNTTGNLGHTVSGVTSQVGGVTSHVGRTVTGTVSGVTKQAGHTVGQVTHAATGTAHQAASTVTHTATRALHTSG